MTTVYLPPTRLRSGDILLGESQGRSMVYETEQSDAIPGMTLVSTEHGPLYLDPEATYLVEQAFNIDAFIDDRESARLWVNASDLLSEADENPEYDRALAELVCTHLGISTENKDDVLAVLRDMQADHLHPLIVAARP